MAELDSRRRHFRASATRTLATIRRTGSIAGLVLVGIGVIGCAMPGMAERYYTDEAPAEEALDAPAPGALATLDDGEATTAAPQRLVIRIADLELRVVNPASARRKAREIAQSRGGFVKFEGDERIVLRVPADRFDDALDDAAKLGPILSREISATDVTEEYRDLELRLRVRTKFLGELEALYERGGSLKDLLEIKREIEKVTEEIERIKGRIRYLKDRIALATITLRFRASSEDPMPGNFSLPFPWLKQLGVDHLLEGHR